MSSCTQISQYSRAGKNFVTDWAEKGRNAFLCQVNSYPAQKEGAA